MSITVLLLKCYLIKIAPYVSTAGDGILSCEFLLLLYYCRSFTRLSKCEIREGSYLSSYFFVEVLPTSRLLEKMIKQGPDNEISKFK